MQLRILTDNDVAKSDAMNIKKKKKVRNVFCENHIEGLKGEVVLFNNKIMINQ